jgi:hypothetical protein
VATQPPEGTRHLVAVAARREDYTTAAHREALFTQQTSQIIAQFAPLTRPFLWPLSYSGNE